MWVRITAGVQPPPRRFPPPTAVRRAWYLEQEDELWKPLDGLHHQPVQGDAVGAAHLPPLSGTRSCHSLASCREDPVWRLLCWGPWTLLSTGLRPELSGTPGSAAMDDPTLPRRPVWAAGWAAEWVSELQA